MDFGLVLSIVVPVFVLIALGAGASRVGLLSETVEHGLAGYMTRFAMPVLLFRVVATGDLPPSPPWALWSAYFAGIAVVYPLAMIAMTRLFGRNPEVGVIGGVSAGFANTVMVGIPVTAAAFGPEGLVILTLLISVHLPIMMLVSAVLITSTQSNAGTDGLRRTLWATTKTLCRNGLVLGLAVGFVARLLGLRPTGVAEQVIDLIADTAIPCALVALGMSLNRHGISGNVRPAILLTVLKLLVMPVTVFAVAHHVLGLPPLWTSVMTITAAAPTGINAYLIASHFGAGLRISSSTITLTAIFSVVTLTVWLSVLPGFGPV